MKSKNSYQLKIKYQFLNDSIYDSIHNNIIHLHLKMNEVMNDILPL